MKLEKDIIHFFQDQGFVVVSTVDRSGTPHNACKGIVEIKENGEVYLLDLYHGQTYKNIKENPQISITAVDEHRFIGYCLKGSSKIVTEEDFSAELLKDWEDRITDRLTQRVLRNLGGQKGHPRHPEALLPTPKYLIAMQVEEIIDLTPKHLKKEV